MKKRLSIKAKLMRMAMSISLTAIVLTNSVAIYTMYTIRNQTQQISTDLGNQAAEDSSEAITSSTLEQLVTVASDRAELIDQKLNIIRRQTESVAALLTQIYKSPDSYESQPVQPPDASKAGEYSTQLIYAAGADKQALEYEVGKVGLLSSVLEQVTEVTSGITTMQVGTESGFIVQADNTPQIKPEFLDPREREWYKLARERDMLSWTDVMDDAYGRGLGIVCAAPVHDADGNCVAVAAAGALLSDINKSVIEAQIGESGYIFIINDKGHVIFSPRLKKDANGSIVREDLLNSSQEQVRDVALKMVNGQSGTQQLVLDGREVYMAYTRLSSVAWSIGAVVDVGEVLEPAYAIQQTINDATLEASKAINYAMLVALALFVLVMASSVVIIIVLSNAASSRIVNPIKRLNLGAREISGGNLDLRLDIQTGDEIESLALQFNNMTQSLNEYMRNLTKATADKQRIATELAVATQIQTAMLPCIFPPFPDQNDFDIYARMEAAKEVGGDFYDFFMIDQSHLGIVIADVSGKGVPAALFMVVAKTLIKNQTLAGAQPAAAFESVNSQLCENNEAGMFVTAFMGILDIATGAFTYVNAGHNPPLYAQRGKAYSWLESKRCFVLAGMEDVRYRQQQITLSPGDSLILYTDGVTEALNRADELYSEARLLELVNSGKLDQKSLRDKLQVIRSDILDFADGAEQADDITMLILQMNEGGAENG